MGRCHLRGVSWFGGYAQCNMNVVGLIFTHPFNLHGECDFAHQVATIQITFILPLLRYIKQGFRFQQHLLVE